MITSNFTLNLSDNNSVDYNDYEQFFYLLLELIRINQPTVSFGGIVTPTDLPAEILMQRTNIDYTKTKNLETFMQDEQNLLECIIRFEAAYTDASNEENNDGLRRNVSTLNRVFDVFIIMPAENGKGYQSSYALKKVTERIVRSILQNDSPSAIQITVPSKRVYHYQPRQAEQVGNTVFPNASESMSAPNYIYSTFRVKLPITRLP